MKKLLIVVLAAAAAQTFATGSDGGYVELQAGSANSSAFNYGVNNSGAIRIDGGIKIDPYMAVEAGFSGLTQPTSSAQQATSLQFYDASFKGTLPLGNVLSLHAQAGLAYATGSTTYYGTDATPKVLLGAGADINLAKNFALVVNDFGYLSPNLDSTSGLGGNTNVVMGGLKYNF